LKKKALTAAFALLVFGTTGGARADTAPYSGMQARDIKALSPQQMEDLRAGRGMGLALAAELNGFPGPSHVLELADALMLSPAVRERTRALLAAMKDEAVPLGQRLIAEEAALDRDFATSRIDDAGLRRRLEEIAGLQAELRYTHLKYHLTMRALLTPEQIASYDRLRGYAGASTPAHSGPGHTRHP
jgi:Spy/CpxP family protein refolding chaperone